MMHATRLDDVRRRWAPEWRVWRSHDQAGEPNEWCATRRGDRDEPSMTLMEPTADALEEALSRESADAEDCLARELALFRKALELPAVGYSQVIEVEQLRTLISRHTEHARHILDEIEMNSHPSWDVGYTR
jgi:hypothetical protein